MIFEAKYDTVSSNEEMIHPLWKKLIQYREENQNHKNDDEELPLQKLVEYPVEHGLLGRRISIIREIANFIKITGDAK